MEDDMKRARTQYETHSSYPGMWTGRWTTSSPNIKEEKSHPVTELPPGHQPPHPGTPPNNQSPHLTSPYPPAPFPDTVVFTQPTTSSSDILYDSINISQAYPTLTSSLGNNRFSINISINPQ